MSMQDTVGDMLTRIRNAQMANKVSVAMPSSKLRKSIADLLVSEGYVASAVVTEEENNKATLTIELKYFEGRAVIETIQRYSRPGLRQFRGKDEIPTVKQGMGVAIVSTSQGIMSDRAARAAGIGGEIVAFVA
ncbi:MULTISPECIES: 30S ribosomal protein S8 [Psychrobacter]|jgi:small subunit ribosomal protein S8|uniref:Small ribosomal subunit protein uS8 n=3 Tax=Psychrobacter TaxID=497 RepID=A0A1G6X920_9GAMM|nr:MULTISPECIES: 30S ribosomal protein S8 [Psychrobacter]MED6315866.1 30S ribosomal protein S8 [Pseudomonadota bacterium]HBD04592.1 30S ribosomal protein S8 [Psychrobacter sp.]AOY44842.1 30S ribosomal protein S8 [Psychrobacter sp. AntiMn-1]KRU21637.1 30S ribosomal protein S8 [Psychrobacter piscatorii]MDH4904178.1 30S ribosomal protein S8 [Psychrobacter pocilloporae]